MKAPASPAPLAWITGAQGLIGNYLATLAPRCAPQWRVRGLTRDDVDLLDFNLLRRLMRRDRPDLIVHCAAITRNPVCTAQPELARRTNVGVTEVLTDLAADARVVLFSTDLVFDGQTGNYDESAAVNPLSVYAETKVEAERIVLGHPRSLVVRTSLNGGVSPQGNRGFNEELRRAWAAGQRLRLFTDEYRCPIFAAVTARAVWELVARKATGILHVAGAESLSRWGIGRLLAARWPDVDASFEAASVRNYDGPPRSPDTSLNCGKAQAMLSFPLPRFSEWLRDHPDEPF